MGMKRLQEYLDFRAYLIDESMRRSMLPAGFSQRRFLQKAGIKSPSLFKQVIDGERNLTAETTEKFIIGLGLEGDDAQFFRHLVGFSQAKSATVKEKHYAAMVKLGAAADVKIVGSELYRFYEKWYLAPLRELVAEVDFGDNWKKLAQMLTPPITATEAKKGVALLEELGLISRVSGRWVQNHPTLSTGHQVDSLAVRQFNRQMLEMAAESLERFPKEKRRTSGITLSLSEEGYRLVEQEIEAVEERILAIAEQDQKEKRCVVQLMNTLFPLAEIERKREKGGKQ